eukprot:TRINITY_DN10785_c0_g1_i3.p1 TRINITY_DN10785_c0_g1~~TRINITY_DN10785_c0_g1_i3.p1  ORF type:complete len:480 (-),score=100.06 TRINITY_DN10785_c0_g1_i3:27-1466(-)
MKRALSDCLEDSSAMGNACSRRRAAKPASGPTDMTSEAKHRAEGDAPDAKPPLCTADLNGEQVATQAVDSDDIHLHGEQEDIQKLGELLQELQLVQSLVDSGTVTGTELRALRQLAEQSVRMGIDYAGLGLGWSHPQSRTQYRQARHQSISCGASRARAEKSRQNLVKLLQGLCQKDGAHAAASVASAFCDEISACPAARRAAEGVPVFAALEGELLLPLRALNEDRLKNSSMARTFNGQALPAKKIEACVDEITLHVLDGSYSKWRYENPVGARQLEGLSEKQKAAWIEPSRTEVGDIVVHEDGPGELGFFWATKIGGPSHGFDIEGQCLLPLLANARHKVVLVTDPQWPHHPAGRAHLRLLWTHAEPQRPVLWLETLNVCFDARVDTRPWQAVVAKHVVKKAQAMSALLSLSDSAARDLQALDLLAVGALQSRTEKLVLRPSNGVVEASDYLGPHDWLQQTEEIIGPFRRWVYDPAT